LFRRLLVTDEVEKTTAMTTGADGPREEVAVLRFQHLQAPRVYVLEYVAGAMVKEISEKYAIFEFLWRTLYPSVDARNCIF
jgi:hypothetical protein